MYTASKKNAFQVFQQQIEELKKGPRERTFEQSKMERDHEKASTTSSSDPLKSETSNEDDEREYITMMADRASCSSDSHLAISGHCIVYNFWDVLLNTKILFAVENQANSEICSFTSESGDSCYSSMANGSLNPRFKIKCVHELLPYFIFSLSIGHNRFPMNAKGLQLLSIIPHVAHKRKATIEQFLLLLLVDR